MRKPTKDEIAQVMAKIAFNPEHNKLTDFQRYAIQLFVEEFVLPEEISEYSEQSLYGYILNAMS